MTVSLKEEGMRVASVACCVIILILFVAGHAEAAYVVGDPVADFTLNDADGNPVSLSEFDGMVVWLMFWTDT